MGTRPREGVGAGQQGLWLGLRCGVIMEEERSRRLVVETDRCSRGIQRMLSKWCSGLVSVSPGSGEASRGEGRKGGRREERRG